MISSEDKQIVVNYHYVEDSHPDRAGIKACSVAEFAREVKFLSENYKIVSVPEALVAARSGSEEKMCALTFDDCMKDAYDNAFPILKKTGVKATFFVITSTFDGVVPAAHKIHILLSKFSAEQLIDIFNNWVKEKYPELAEKFYIPKDRRIEQKRAYDDMLTANFKETLILLPHDTKEEFIAFLFRDYKINEAELSRELFMSKENISELSREGMHIGSHSHSHNALETMGPTGLAEEARLSKKIITEIIGKDIDIFSYPHGHWFEEVDKVLLSEGFKYGVTIEKRPIDKQDTAFLIPRYDTNSVRDYLNKKGYPID